MKRGTISPEVCARVLRIANRVYRRYYWTGVSLDDLVQEGFVSYIATINRPEQSPDDPPFPTSRVRGAMLDFLRKYEPSCHKQRYWRRRIREITNKIRDATGRDPVPEEIAEAAGITQQELEANTTRRHRVSDQILESIPAPGQEEDPAKTVVTSIIDLAKLNETQVTVLRLLSEGHMRKDIATVFGVSASRISQIFKKIAEKLRGTAKRHAITPP